MWLIGFDACVVQIAITLLDGRVIVYLWFGCGWDGYGYGYGWVLLALKTDSLFVL